MERTQDVRRSLEELLGSQLFAVLSTQSHGGPHAGLVAFWAAPDLSRVVFATLRETRKFAQISSDPRVALLFDDRSNRESDLREATAATAVGMATEITEERARTAAAREFLNRHPRLLSFVEEPGCALMEVAVERYRMVSRFQEVVELPM